MLFAELMQAIHPHLMKDADVPEFTRNVIQMLCDIPEKDWCTKKDPSSDKNYKDASLRKFYTRGITKKLAKRMLGRLTRDQFIEAIEDPDRNDVVLEGLIEDVEPFLNEDEKSKVDTTKIGDILFDLFKKALEYAVDPNLENDRKLAKAKQVSHYLKPSFGDSLLRDCHATCSMPGCGKSLLVRSDNGSGEFDYEIVLIDESKGRTYPNLIAACHDYFTSYALHRRKKNEKELLAIKKIQSDAQNCQSITDETEIERGISLVIEKLVDAKPEECQALNYDPVAITQKIDKKENDLLVSQVKMNVSKYYLYIEKVMQTMAKENKYPDDLIRVQIKHIYTNLEKAGSTPNQIFATLTDRLVRMTKQNRLYCGVVVSYFIQSCEVFHDLAK